MALVMYNPRSVFYEGAVIGWHSVNFETSNKNFDFEVAVWDSTDKKVKKDVYNTSNWSAAIDLNSENFDDMFQHLLQESIKEISITEFGFCVGDQVKIVKGKNRLGEVGIIFKILENVETFNGKTERKYGIKFSENFELMPNSRGKGSYKKWLDAEWVWASFVVPENSGDHEAVYNAAFDITINKIKELRG